MGIDLLSPAALALIGLFALPIIAHMSRQIPRERFAFGAMLLLERVMKRLKRRRRLRDPLLLLLRLLALLCIIAAMMGPRLSFPGGMPEVGGSGRVVFVLDRSLSMGQQVAGSTLLAQARSEALSTLQSLPEGTLVGVVGFDATAERLTPNLTADKGRVARQIEALQPTYGTTDLRGALVEARKLLGGEAGEVLLYSDEAGERTVVEAQSEIAALVEQGSSVYPRLDLPESPRNVAVVEASYEEGLEGGTMTLRVQNYGKESTEVSCEVTLPDGQAIPVFVDIPPEGLAEERITIPPEALGGVGVAHCEDSDLETDDRRYFHLPRVGASRVLVVDGDPGDTPTKSEIYFLEKALSPWGGLKTGVSIDVTTPFGLMELDPSVHRVVFIANLSDPRPFGPLLTEFVRQGGSLVISGGENVTAERYNAALGPVLPAPLRKPRALTDPAEPGIPVEIPTLGHPLFQPFERGGRSSFTRIRSTKVLTLEPYDDTEDVTTLLRYEGGIPALVERKIGGGRVVLWTSTVDWAWTSLPLEAPFMPLVQRLVQVLGGESGGGAARFDAEVGQRVELPLPDLALEPLVKGPRGDLVTSRVEGSRLLFDVDEPGAYEVALENAPALAWVAVNTSAAESDVRRFTSVAAVEQEINPEAFLQYVDLSQPALWLGLLGFLLQLVVAQGGGRE